MTDAQPESAVDPADRPHWRMLLQPRWLAWHIFAVVAVVGMLWLGWWQFSRAIRGNELSWAYTFEWPIFAVFGVVFWIKTIRDELTPPDQRPSAPGPVRMPAGIGGSTAGAQSTAGSNGHHGPEGQPAEADADDDPAAAAELEAYNAYLARLSKETSRHGRWHGLR